VTVVIGAMIGARSVVMITLLFMVILLQEVAGPWTWTPPNYTPWIDVICQTYNKEGHPTKAC
jgi:hypothetical protein